MKFINRKKEVKRLRQHFESEPNSLLFVYGPKSSGKSTLLMHVAEQLDAEKYSVNFLDLRQVLVNDFDSFLNVFFNKKTTDKLKDIASGITLNTGFIKVETKEMDGLKQNPFGIISKKLQNANKRGLRPIIIIDEIQLLKHIKLDKNGFLIDELFNLFIGLTKVVHVAHIVLATSDSFFIEEIYGSSKLRNTSRFMLIDHFDKKTVMDWLVKENFTNEEIDELWEQIGGCPWQITEIIKEKYRNRAVSDSCKYFIKNGHAKLADFTDQLEPSYNDVFRQVTKKMLENGSCHKSDIEDKQTLDKLLKVMVEHDFWFYLAEDRLIIPNDQSIFQGLKKM